MIVFLVVSSALLFLILFSFNRLLKRKVAQATRELADKNRALEEAESKLPKTIEVVSSLPLFEMQEEEFLSRIMDLALEIIPKARYGSVLLLGNDGKGKLVVLRGHDEGLQGFTFEPQDFLAKEQATIIKNPLDPQRPFTSLENYKKLLELSKPIAESLIIPLWWEGQLFGQLDLDIPKESNEHFTETDVKVMENLACICNAFHALRAYARKEETFLEKLLLVLMKTLEYHDRPTRGHSEISARYVLWITRKLHFNLEQTRKLYWATFIHDVGKSLGKFSVNLEN